MIPFKSLFFGYMSAEVERVDEPELLTRGFVDPFNAIHELIHGSRSVVLGDKGAGKSAIREHIDLLDDPHLAASAGDLSGFSFDTIKQAAGVPSTDEAWRLVLLLQLVNSLERDTGVRGANHVVNEAWADLLANLRQRGLIFSHLGAPTTRIFRQIQGGLSAGLLNIGREQSSELNPGHVPLLVQTIEAVVFQLRTSTQHVVIIDGLDDVFSDEGQDLQTVASLIRESVRLTTDFRRYSIPARVIVSCRHDVFEALRDPNMNKIANDRAVVLDWWPSGTRLQHSPLVKFIEHRSKMVSDEVDLWAYFPVYIEGFQKTTHWLFRLTRYTPRDLVVLMKSIQDVVPSSTTELTRDNIIDGAKAYSERYFYHEVRDQLVGFVEDDRFSKYMQLITSLRKRQFWPADFRQHAEHQPEDVSDMDQVFSALYNAGAVGHIRFTEKKREHRTWKFRNRNSRYDPQMQVEIHPGLWKALNLVFDNAGDNRTGSNRRNSRRKEDMNRGDRR